VECPVLASLGDRQPLNGRGEVGQRDHLARLDAARDHGSRSDRECKVPRLPEAFDAEAEGKRGQSRADVRARRRVATPGDGPERRQRDEPPRSAGTRLTGRYGRGHAERAHDGEPDEPPAHVRGTRAGHPEVLRRRERPNLGRVDVLYVGHGCGAGHRLARHPRLPW
jgi:hypothetical protein